MLQQQQSYETFNHGFQVNTSATETRQQSSRNGIKKTFLAKVIAGNAPTDETQGESIATNSHEDFPRLYAEVNDVVTIEEELDEKFYLAKSDQQTGKLAKSECLILDDQIPHVLCQYLTENQFFDLHICFASFVAQDVGDLSTTRGDIIVAINPVNEHWLQGQVCYDSQANCWPKLTLGKQVGTFPLNHCWQLDSEQVKTFCQSKLNQEQHTNNVVIQPVPWPSSNPSINSNKPSRPATHSSSLSSGSSSLYSTECANVYNHHSAFIPTDIAAATNNYHNQLNKYANQSLQLHDKVDSKADIPPPRPAQLPRQISDRQKSSSEQAVSRPSSVLSNKQQAKLKGWLNTVRKKTTRCAMRISANLGFISLTRDEEFERHYDSFKQLEKSIRVFIKNLTLFVEHFESFLLALQSTSDNLADFYRDKTLQKEITELRKKNKALNCEHFHAFKRTVDRQVIAVASQLLQKFSGPHQLIQKRSAKLLDFDTKTKEMESCRDLEKKAALRERYVIAKDLYDRINGQLIEELPLFNQFVLDIFKECILVLLESRKNLIMSYTKQTESLLKTPLMSSFTASDVASTIMMTCDFATNQTGPAQQPPPVPPPPPASIANTMGPPSTNSVDSEINSILNQDFKGSQTTSEHGTHPSGSGVFRNGSSSMSRPQSALSQLSSEFDQIAIVNREKCSTPLSELSGSQQQHNRTIDSNQHDISAANDSNHFDEPDTVVRFAEPGDVHSDNKQNEEIESAIVSSKADDMKLESAAPSRSSDNEVASKDKRRKKRTKHPIYIASWPFVATGPNQLTIACNQQLKLLKGCDSIGNSDWSLVKNQLNEIGYVPTAYLKKKEP